MQLFSIFHLMLKYSETSHLILSAIRDRMHLFSVSDLLMLSVMFDPSQDFIKHLVQQSQRSRFVPGRGLQHSASMDSLNQLTLGWNVSVSDSTYSPVRTKLGIDLADGSESQREVRPQSYFEMFIESLLWLNQKRLQDNTSSFLHNELFIQNTSKLLSNFLKLNETETNSGIQVSCGSSHAGYLLHNQVFMWTTSVDHVLSPSSFIAEDMHPLTVPLLSFLHIKVLEISCGMEHSLVRTSYGVYAWGDNRCGQLGVGDRNKRQLPTVIDSLSSKQIIAIACGEAHSLMLDSVNRVHVFGDNRYGQLGIGTKDPYQTIPFILPLPVSIVQACGGSMHSVLLSADGVVYAMGSNYYGQLGVEGLEESSEPVRVEILTEYRVLAIASGTHTCVACGRNTQLWLWGKNIGNQEIDSEVEQIEQSKSALITLDIDLKVGDQLKEVAVGISHCLLLTKNGFILSWGSNEYGQCGVGTYSHQQEPEILPINLTGVRFISISAHMNISAAIDSQNRCFVWGNIFPYSVTPSTSLTSEATLCVSPSVCSNLPSLIHHIQSEWDISILSESHNEVDELNERISDFPDFSCLGSISYGSEALESALKELYGLYSSSRISRLCHSMNNLQASAVLMEMRGDIPRALEFKFRHLVQTTTQQELLPRLTELLYIHLDSLLSQNQGAHTIRASFLNQGILLIRSAHSIFLAHSLPLESLEEVFVSRIEGLAYPLYLFIKDIIENGDSPPFSLSLCTQIILITAHNIAEGHPDPLLVLSSNEHTSITRPVNEGTIWGHIIHNLTKDLDSSESFQIDYNRVKSFYTSATDHEMVLFSCGHFYSGHEFNKTVLPKFENLISQNLPSFGKQTTQRILQHYWNEDKFNIGCPACVFINLQQIATNN
ncbi:hypothetical protein LOD99_8244 [Oopsacas minuta]|uniref:RCC1-like domain-containing protein n=1 Tax=Oopsacas minuta TaxID=111878 RepID=A0AAV7JGU8_9METZ|nr:hypothetical protein LOD99_8244 [Oopsacas minuta]